MAPSPTPDPAYCQPQEHTWWSQKCSGCGHALLLHEEVPGQDGIACVLCGLKAHMETRIEEQTGRLEAKIAARGSEIKGVRDAFNAAAPVIPADPVPEPETEPEETGTTL